MKYICRLERLTSAAFTLCLFCSVVTAQTLQVEGSRLGVGISPDTRSTLRVAGTMQSDADASYAKIPQLYLRRLSSGTFDGTGFTIDVGMGAGLTNLVAGASLMADGTGYTYLGTRGASRILMNDGLVQFFTSDGTSATPGAMVPWSNGNGPALSIDAQGKVAIGGGPLMERLEVGGHERVSGYLKFSNAAADENDGKLGNSLFASGLNLVGINNDNTYRKIQVWGQITQQQNNGTNTWTGTNYFGGAVGIGAAIPQFALDVSGTVRVGGFTTGDTDEWPNFVWLREGTWDEGLIKGSSLRSVFGRAGFGIHMHSSRGFGFYSSGWDALWNLEGGTGRMYVKGNVGLGAVSPQQRLQLSNGQYLAIASNYGSYIPTSWNRGNAGGIILASSVNPDGSGWAYGSRIVNQDYGDGLGLSFDVLYAAGWTNNALFVSGRASTLGNIGLGTTNPTHRLTVNGQVKAKGYLVDSSNWADFVFEPGYRLPALSSVEAHIREQGHLPGIPSKSEVQAKGVDLAEMQVRLLQKVEELTLYTIQLKNENDAAHDAIEQLKKRVAELEMVK